MGGCVSSNFLNPTDENFSSQLNASTLSNHFVKLTSTTYGLLNLDSSSSPSLPPPPSSSATSAISPMTPPERFTINGKETMVGKSEPTTTEVINFWKLMSGLDGGDTCRFSPISAESNVSDGGGVMMVNKENSDPNLKSGYEVLKPLDPKLAEEPERICDGGEDRVVIYTTSLRGVRRTFEACNAVRAAIESFGVVVCERDVSMDRGFREELSSLMARERRDNGYGGGDDSSTTAVVVLPPRVFVKGKYIGGAEEVMSLVEEGLLGDLLRGIPRKKDRCGGGCGGCGGLAFLPCSECNGSCKVVEGWGSEAVVAKCRKCNENGLVRCPICS
ncbi:PREDICTED: uncharacterized protein At3g28850-like [Camelina sativa]|uniref:Uncharacterized protein At3g28850-like n=1 Tax=Camelina sativa TaxID=90675 RepID=A0ABM0VU19_CAMSA|nr:PREDICTED: uncharacterized protein At3g28850-like [Camelina sativa]